MTQFASPVHWILCSVLVLSSLGVILAKKPVYAGLSFLLALLTLSGLYLQLSAQFIAVMQVLVYAGAILVIFMFVIILFQDAHQQIHKFEAKSSPILLMAAAFAIFLASIFLGARLIGLIPAEKNIPDGFGSVQSLGKLLYVDFFLPFEAVILLFLIAVVGALYIGRKEA